MQSVPPSPGHWRSLKGYRQCQGRLQSLPVPMMPLRAWPLALPSQMYAIQARKHTATSRRAGPDITIETRWCFAHKGAPGNEKIDGWAELAAEEPGSREVECMRVSDRHIQFAAKAPTQVSCTHLKREISEEKQTEAKCWAAGQVSGKKYALPTRQRPDGTVAGSSRRLAFASRFCQLKTGLEWTRNQPTAKCWWCPCKSQTRVHVFRNLPPLAGRLDGRDCGQRFGRRLGEERIVFGIPDLLADARCSRAALDFLSATGVGRRVPAPAGEDTHSETSELELRERRERGEERRREAGGLGAGREEPLFFPTPSFMASAGEE